MRKFILLLFIFALLALTTAVLWAYVYGQNSGKLEIFILDVGQGDAILIHSPDNIWALVDTGRSGTKLVQELSEVWNYWERPLSFVLATHADSDHIGGMVEVLSHYDVGRVLMNGVSKQNKTLLEIEGLLYGSYGSISVDQNSDFRLGCCVEFDVVWPPNEHYYLENDETNDQSIAFVLSYKDFEIFMDGDLGHEFEDIAVQAVKVPEDGIDILKLGHHGSKTSTSQLVLDTLKPKLAVVSVGARNSYGHPAKEVVDRVLDLGIPLWSTGQSGRLHIVTDGIEGFIEAEKVLEPFELKL